MLETPDVDIDPVKPTRMDPAIKAQWIAALRGGGYRQGIGHLKEGDRYCCLGVLCELKPDHSWGEAENNKLGYDDGDAPTEYPGPSVLGWAGLAYRDMEGLAEMNDDGSTFEDLADYIEENL